MDPPKAEEQLALGTAKCCRGRPVMGIGLVSQDRSP